MDIKHQDCPQPAIERINTERFGRKWVGTYEAPDGRIAVVTEVASRRDSALAAAARWVEKGEAERSSKLVYEWRLDPQYPNRHVPVRLGILSECVVREAIPVFNLT